MERIKLLLESHVGKGNEISAQVIENEFGNPSDSTHKTARELIETCIEKYDLPVAANNRGYFLISNEKEYEEYIKNLDSRIKGIEDRKETIRKNYEKWKV